jgi:hypothetical protein
VQRLPAALNKRSVVLVAGVVAVAVNLFLYFGYWLPRTTPLIERIPSISKSIPEAIPEAISKSLPKASPESPSDSPPKSPSDSPPEAPPQQQQAPTPQQQQYL